VGEGIHQLIAMWLLLSHYPRPIIGLPTNYNKDKDDDSIYKHLIR
jgi:hypothetical protein